MAVSTAISQPSPGSGSSNRQVTAIPPQNSAHLSNPTQPTPSTSSITSSLAALSSQPQTTSTPSNSNAQNKYRPLNVRDALSYLDQVKVQFQDLPGVYNKFLDIMKDFKTQMIDTPGVIDGVSSLFRGHPSLIQGFNTFLPPGYRIDVSQGDGANQTGPSSAYSLITVTHPMGIQTQKRVPLQTGGEEFGSHVVPEPADISPPTSRNEKHARENLPVNSSNHIISSKPLNEPPSAPVVTLKPNPITLDAIANSNRHPSPAPSNNPSIDQPKPAVKPLEFNHAINYVNKVKNRYSGDPKTYQTFLDILQTYQRDARPIQEVYEQVNQLFRGAPDLMTEFMQFLPDPSINPTSTAATDPAGIQLLDSGGAHFDPSEPTHPPLSNTPSSSKRGIRDLSTNIHLDARYPLSSHTGAPALNHEAQSYTSFQHTAKKRRHGASNSAHNSLPPSNEHSMPCGSRSHASFPELISNRGGEMNGEYTAAGHLVASPSRGIKRKHRPQNRLSDPAISGASALGLPPPGFAPPGCATIGEAYHTAVTTNQLLDRGKRRATPNSRNARPPDRDSKHAFDIPPDVPKPTTGREELSFFYHLKTAFENPSTYIEFLKIINLFTQDLIDLETLVSKIKPFLINCPELFSRFKDIVGWQDEPDKPKNRGSTNGHLSKKKPRPYFEHNIPPHEGSPQCGPSYRFLPDSEILSNCSGRDALCWDVLNDKLVCGAPGTNEDDQIFLPRQTNAFERALYQAEDERHEYDYHIEANVRTIALLEPIHLRIQQMDPETRAEYRLKPGLGGQSKSVYQRIIKKIYGKQQGQEVIHALHENPALAVPIVLARLKQKDEEWKRALRDWNRVWREVDGKNFWKALDHQGISFKALDKKVIANRNLINEIELIKREQQNKQKLLLNPSLIRYLPKHQLELELESIAVFYDVLKIFIHFLDHAPNSPGLDDGLKDRIEAHLKSIVTMFFNIPAEEFDKHLTPLPPERTGVLNENSIIPTNKNVDANGNERAYSEGDASDTTANGGHNPGGDDEWPEGSTVGRPTRGLSSGRRRGASAKDGASNTTAASDLRKRAMKNASTSGGVIHSERASARRNESNKKGPGSSRTPHATSRVEGTASPSRTSLPAEGIVQNPPFGSELTELTPGAAADGSPWTTDQKPFQTDITMADGIKNAMDAVAPSPQANSSSNLSSLVNSINSGTVTDSSMAPSHPQPDGPDELQTSSRGKDQQEEEEKVCQKSKLSFFANNGYYCFFRLIHILYTRFKTLKLASTMDIDHHLSTKLQQILLPNAKTEEGDNTIITPPPPNNLDGNSSSSASNPSNRSCTPNSAYQQLLATVESFNSGAIDQTQFEDECRHLFGIKGYLVVTVDKVCQALVKVLSKLSDHEGSKKILQLFKNQKKSHDEDPGSLTDHQRLGYRRSVESLTGKGHESKVYRMEWVPDARSIRIQLLGGDEISPEDFDNIEKAWSDYLASFQDMSVERTLGLENFTINPPFLKRNMNLVKKSATATMPTVTTSADVLKDDGLCSAEQQRDNQRSHEELSLKEENFITETGLEIRICIRSYRMFFNPNKTELLMRKIHKKL